MIAQRMNHSSSVRELPFRYLFVWDLQSRNKRESDKKQRNFFETKAVCRNFSSSAIDGSP